MAKLVDAIQVAIERALEASADKVVRVDLPRTWPVACAITQVVEGTNARRVLLGILRPFWLKAFAGLAATVSDKPEKITSWRNRKTTDQVLVVLGRADAESTEGLRDFAQIVRRSEPISIWRELENDTLPVQSGKPEVARLVTALFDACSRGHVDAVALDAYLTEVAVGVRPSHLQPIYDSMWRLRLVPDDQALDRGAASQRLQVNLSVVSRLGAPDERGLRSKIMNHSKGSQRKAQSARAALKFMASSDEQDLQEARLADLLTILGERGASAGSARSFDFDDLINQAVCESDHGEALLAELRSKWDLSDTERTTIRVSQVEEEPTTYHIDLRPAVEERTASDDSPVREFLYFWAGDDDQVLIAVSSKGQPRAFDNGEGWTVKRASDFLKAAEATSDPAAAAVVSSFKAYLAARSDLRLLEPWLGENGFELLSSQPVALGAVDNFVEAWCALMVSAVCLQEAAGLLRFLQLIEAAWGPSVEGPSWSVLGPFHPFRLEPLRRVAANLRQQLTESGTEKPADAARWLLERCDPAYPAIYFAEHTFHLAKTEGHVTYIQAATDHLPRADEGHGLSQALRCIRGFSPHLAAGLTLFLVDPPPGRAIGSEVARLGRDWGGEITILVAVTRSDANPLDDVEGDVRFVGRFDDLTDLVLRTDLQAHIAVCFTPQPKGTVAARQGWTATRGSFLAPHLEVSMDPLLEGGATVAEVSIEPRKNNQVVCLSHELHRRQTGNTPKHFQFRPMLPTRDITALRALAGRTEWLVVAPPGPMGLATPSRINSSIAYVGRESLGPFGLFVYACDDLFAVRRFVERGLQHEPVAISPESLSERLTALAKQSGAAILRMGRDGVMEHQAALVALSLAQADADPAKYQDIILRVDDVGWTRIWIGESRRCDFLMVRVAKVAQTQPRIVVRAVESKSLVASEPVPPSLGSHPFAAAVNQIDVTLHALRTVMVCPTGATLDQDVRFSSFIEHLMAAVLASDPDFSDPMRLRAVIGTLNELSARSLVEEDVEFEGLAVVTQTGTNADRAVIAGRTEKGFPVKIVRATAKDASALLGVGMIGALVSIDAAASSTMGQPPVEKRGTQVENSLRSRDGVIARRSRVEDSTQVLSAGSAVPPDWEWAMQKALDLAIICRRHQIPVTDSDEPARVILGPSLVAISLRLRIGAQIGAIEKRIDDLMRDIGLGERSKEVSVVNDPEPSTVRFILPRPSREIPALPTKLPGPVASGGYLPILVGRTIEGQDYSSPVEEWPHMLVAGTTGSGKTTFLRTLIKQLVAFGGGLVRLILVDGKGDMDYVGLVPGESFVDAFPAPLLGHQHVPNVLSWLLDEMERRRHALHEVALREGTLKALKWPDLYRETVKAEGRPDLVPIVVVIDEFADIMQAGRSQADEFLSAVQRLAQVGRSRLIHLVLATQRPDKETIRGAIKTNLDARVVLRLPTVADSMTVLGRGGAERLLKYGDLIFEVGGSAVRLQGYSA